MCVFVCVCLLLIRVETTRINKELYDTRMKHQWNNPLILQITGNHSNPWPHCFHLSALEQFPFVSIFASLNLDLSGGVHRCQRHKRLRAALRQTSCANNSDDCNDADTHSIQSFFFLLLYLSRAYQRLRDKLYRNYQDGRRSLAFQLQCLQWRRHAGPSRTRTSLSRSRKLTRVVTLSWGPTPSWEAPVLPSCRCMSCVVSVSVCRFRPLTIMSRASSRRQELIIRRRLADSTTLPFFDFYFFLFLFYFLLLLRLCIPFLSFLTFV